MRTLSIVIPSYNEAKNVEPLLKQLTAALEGLPHEIIFVDDSTDETPQVIARQMKRYPQVRMEHRTKEKGLATAVLRGFEMATGEYLAVMDADLQHPPQILRSMYDVMESGCYDICIPSRFIPGGSDGGLNLYRKTVSGVARYIGKILLPCLRRLTDPTSGLFMFCRQVIARGGMKPIGWKIMVEVLAMGHYDSVVEIPYAFQDRDLGESKLSYKVTLEYLQQLVGLMRRATKRKSAAVVRLTPQQLKEIGGKAQ